MKHYLTLFATITILAGCSSGGSPVAEMLPDTTGSKTIRTDTAVAMPMAIPFEGSRPESFVLRGYFIQYQATGDIDSNGLADEAMILREVSDSTGPRAFLVLLQQKDHKYMLADSSWTAIGPQCTAEGFPVRGAEMLEIKNGNIELQLFEPGPAGNLFSTYRLINGSIVLTELETFNQGAGGKSRMKHYLLTGLQEFEEINLMTDPETTTPSGDTVTPQRILLHDSNPDELVYGKEHL